MITAAERHMLVRLAGALAPRVRDALLGQIQTVAVHAEGRGHLRLSVSADTGALPPHDIDIIESSYRDVDGVLVEVLLHFEQPRGVISWLEWFRYDGVLPLRFSPPADALSAPVVQLMPS
jgi:hypothetical protein